MTFVYVGLLGRLGLGWGWAIASSYWEGAIMGPGFWLLGWVDYGPGFYLFG